MSNFIFNFKIEEMAPITSFARQSFMNYRDKFIGFSPIYGDGYLENLDSKLEVVTQVVLPKTLMVQLKQETTKLYSNLDTIKKNGLMLKRYVEMAGSKVAVGLKDLNFSGLRKTCDHRDAEGALGAMKRIDQLLEPYMDVLQTQGYSQEMQDEWKSLAEEVKSGNIAQNEIMNKIQQLAEDNTAVLNELWEMVNGILRTGKLLFKDDKLKQKEFTLTEIRKRVRHDVA